ncbi:ribonucleotide reductase, all-alpha domain protein, partial [Opisthorchis viverrini]
MGGKLRGCDGRDDRTEGVHCEEISERIRALCDGLDESCLDIPALTRQIITGLCPRMTTSGLDNLAAGECAYMTTRYRVYGALAARPAVSNLHKNTKASVSEVTEDLYGYVTERTKLYSLIMSEEVSKIIRENADRLNSEIDYQRKPNCNYFDFTTLELSCLFKLHGKVHERPLLMASIGIHKRDIDAAIETYNLMSENWFTHASPK